MKFIDKMISVIDWASVAICITFGILFAIEGVSRCSVAWIFATLGWVSSGLLRIELGAERRRSKDLSTSLPPLWKSGGDGKEEKKCDG